MTALLKQELEDRGITPLVNRWSNTVCFPRPADAVIHKYCMACNGNLSHVVVMQYFTPELIRRLVDDIAGTRD